MILVYSMGRVGTTSIAKAVNGIIAHYLSYKYGEWSIETGQRRDADKAIKRGDLKTIVPIRHPLARALSAFVFNKKYNNEYNYKHGLNWFDVEFKEYTGFDIYSVPFSPKGYLEIETSIGPVLIIKCEYLDEIGPKVIGDFCGFQINEMPHEEVQDYPSLGISKEMITDIFTSRYYMHFYGEM